MEQQRPKFKLTTVWLFAPVITMWILKNFWQQVKHHSKDENFLHWLEELEVIVSKILSVAMIFVILASIWNLGLFMVQELLIAPLDSFGKTLFKMFGLFLNVLIALEILENISAYLKKHVIQVELVIVTSIIAVARKIIILDLEKIEGVQIIGLAFSIFALSVSYWIVKRMHTSKKG